MASANIRLVPAIGEPVIHLNVPQKLHLQSHVKVKVTQSYLILCDPMDSTVHGILQARILKWVAFPFFRGSSQPMDQAQVFHIAGGFFIT